MLSNTYCFLSFAVLAFFSGPANAKEDLLSLYKKLKQSDHSVVNKQMLYKAAIENEKASKAEFYPQIEASWRYSNHQLSKDFANSTRITCVLDCNTHNSDFSESFWQLSITQTLYDADKWEKLKISNVESNIAQFEHSSSEQALLLRASELYFSFLLARDNLEFAKAESEALEETVRQSRKKFDLGVLSITDVHESQARYDLANANIILAESNLRTLQDTIEIYTGYTFDSPAPLSANFSIKSLNLKEFDALLMNSQKFNNDLKVQEYRVKKFDLKFQQAIAEHYPTVELFYKRTSLKQMQDFNNLDRENKVGIQFKLPLFSGGKHYFSSNKAQLIKDSEREKLSSLQLEIHNKLKNLHVNLFKDLNALTQFKKAVQSNDSALKATAKEFVVGSRSMLDVLLATQSLYRAKRLHAEIQYRSIINYLHLAFLSGELDISTITDVNKLLVRY